jgi:hypothetical protein
VADLDAEIDEPPEDWQQLDSGAEDGSDGRADVSTPQPSGASAPNTADTKMVDASEEVLAQASPGEGEAGDVTMMIDSPLPSQLQQQQALARPGTSNPVPIPNATLRASSGPIPSSARTIRTPSPTGRPGANGEEGPLTPRNDAGPWVYDGDAGRASQEVARQGSIHNLDVSTSQVQTKAA